MKINIPEDLKGKELTTYLIKNKKQLISYKKIGTKEGAGVGFSTDCQIQIPKNKALKTIKADDDSSIEPNTLIAENIANLAGWMDFDNDVIVNGGYNKTIADKKNNRPSMKNHNYNTDSIIGDTLEVRVDSISPKDLGIDTDVLLVDGAIFRTLVRKVYDSKTYYKYLHGAIKEHSIGLRYIKLELAINDPDEVDEYKTWNKYYSQIINKDRADSIGYFWAVLEIDIIENSAVVFGSSSATPTISIEEGKTAAKSTVSIIEDDAVNTDTSKNKDCINYFKYL